MTTAIYCHWSTNSTTQHLQDRLSKLTSQIDSVRIWPDDDSMLYRVIAERDAIREELERRDA